VPWSVLYEFRVQSLYRTDQGTPAQSSALANAFCSSNNL
jgi:hypothetical protein